MTDPKSKGCYSVLDKVYYVPEDKFQFEFRPYQLDPYRRTPKEEIQVTFTNPGAAGYHLINGELYWLPDKAVVSFGKDASEVYINGERATPKQTKPPEDEL